MWPTPTRGVSEIRLALRYRSNDSLLRHFKDTSTLYLEIVDYPGSGCSTCRCWRRII